MPSHEKSVPPPDPRAQEQDAEPEPAVSKGDGARPDLLSARAPTVLGLVRLSRRRVFPPGGQEVYRHVARMLELGPEHEFVLVPCGRGTTVQFLAEYSEAAGAGVDPDHDLVQWAVGRAKEAGLATRIQYEAAPLDDLPYQDAVFDVAIGELGISAAGDPAAAVRELARVTEPLGTIVLIQLTWTGNIDPERREAVVEHLGVRPYLLVEWKQMMREAGVVDLQVEDWSDAATSLRQPFVLRGLASVYSFRERLSVLYRAWRRWGWRGIPATVLQQREINRLISEERVLGLSVIWGRKWRPGPDARPEAPDS